MEELIEGMPTELIEELQRQDALRKQYEDEKKRQLDALSKVISKKRDEAIKARKTSGIETIWQEDRIQ